jgi:TRAP transporter TAXI family solute receptor
LLAACSTIESPTLNEIGLYSAGPGSAFLPYAQGVAGHAFVKGLRVQALETTGSIENIRKVNVETGRAGTVFMGSAYEAYTGSGAWTKGEKFTNLRALFPMYETSFQMAALNSSGINSLRALAGKRVGVGPAGGPAEVFFVGLVEALNIKTVIVNGQPAEMVKDMLEGRIDVLWQGSPPPIPSLNNVLDLAPATVFGLTADEQAAMIKRFPFLTRATVPPGTYKNQTAPILSAAAWNFVLVHKDFPVADAYLLTKAVMSASDPRTQIYPAAANTRAADAAANTFLPFHPGALKYYREAGVTGLK